MMSLGGKRRPGLGGGLGGGLGNPEFGAFSSPLGGDSTPGGAASALLLEDGTGLLLESGDFILLEA